MRERNADRLAQIECQAEGWLDEAMASANKADIEEAALLMDKLADFISKVLDWAEREIRRGGDRRLLH